MNIKKVYKRPQTELLDMEIQQLCYSMPTGGNGGGRTNDNWARDADFNFQDDSEVTGETQEVAY